VIFPKQHGVASQVSQHLDDISACDVSGTPLPDVESAVDHPDRAPFERFGPPGGRRIRVSDLVAQRL